MVKVGKKSVLVLFGLLVLSLRVWAVLSITVSGNWTLSITQSNLSGGAGSDLVSTYNSSTNLITMGISGATSSTDTWRIDIRKSDVTWNASLHLFIKRTNNGTSGTGAVTGGGSSFQEITGTSTQYITGRGNRSGITHQERIQGVSASLAVATYSTTVIFTIVDT